MEYSKIAAADQSALEQVPDRCCDVVAGCLDVGAILEKVVAQSERLRSDHGALGGTIADLEADQDRVSEACDESRLLSERAIMKLGDGNALIRSSLTRIADVLDLVQALATHATGFAAAMDQVKDATLRIEELAETTSILALNATIEAMRAGEQGKAFAVVANEVKGLASSTREATTEITQTIAALDGQAEAVVSRIADSTAASDHAKDSIRQIEQTIGTVTEIVGEVDQQNDQIARATGTISGHVARVQDMLERFDEAALTSEAMLQNAGMQMKDLELSANSMFDTLIKAGLSPLDTEMAERAMKIGQEIADIMEKAVAEGSVSERALFDHAYQEIPGSNPVRYRTAMSDWAGRTIRPILDRVQKSDPRIRITSCADINGWLPTHCSSHSRPPTGDLKHDTEFCRDGRKILHEDDRRAKASTDRFTMTHYRQEGDGETHVTMRNVYVPIVVNGRRWGDYELPYRAEG